MRLPVVNCLFPTKDPTFNHLRPPRHLSAVSVQFPPPTTHADPHNHHQPSQTHHLAARRRPPCEKSQRARNSAACETLHCAKPLARAKTSASEVRRLPRALLNAHPSVREIVAARAPLAILLVFSLPPKAKWLQQNSIQNLEDLI